MDHRPTDKDICRHLTATLVLTLLLLVTAHGCAAESPTVKARIDAISYEPGLVIFNTQIFNRSDSPLLDVSLRVAVAQGAVVQETWSPEAAQACLYQFNVKRLTYFAIKLRNLRFRPSFLYFFGR